MSNMWLTRRARFMPWLAAGAGLLATLALPAAAHTGVGPVSGFGAGLLHPLWGADHLLVMIAAGVWAARLGGRTQWLVAASFLAALAAGAALGSAGGPVPLVEAGIIASVAALGALILFGRGLPAWPAMGLAAAFALFQGYAHGAEAVGGLLYYGLGLMVTSALLQLLGMALGAGIGRVRRLMVRRLMARRLAARAGSKA